MAKLAISKPLNKFSGGRIVLFISETHGFEVKDRENLTSLGKLTCWCPHTQSDVWEILEDVDLEFSVSVTSIVRIGEILNQSNVQK